MHLVSPKSHQLETLPEVIRLANDRRVQISYKQNLKQFEAAREKITPLTFNVRQNISLFDLYNFYRISKTLSVLCRKSFF